ncbi:MAG: methylmalonyl-CoA mutase, partial [Candidatus Eisenbacteria sp.]|nr:methylmalonyl-CoA mutase [Candidatus Eisenbacteria bacterium]
TDPLGGSYYVEALTDRIESEARAELDRIDGMGGATAAIENGHFQRAIAKSAYRQQKEVENEERVVVGVNRYTVDEPARMEVLRVDPSIREDKLEALARLRDSRDSSAVEGALKRLEDDAVEGTPTMEAALECARRRVTLGEMSSALEKVFGRYKPSQAAW